MRRNALAGQQPKTKPENTSAAASQQKQQRGFWRNQQNFGAEVVVSMGNWDTRPVCVTTLSR